MSGWSRRRFVRSATLGGLAALTAACGVRPASLTSRPSPEPLAIPTQPNRQPLTNAN